MSSTPDSTSKINRKSSSDSSSSSSTNCDEKDALNVVDCSEAPPNFERLLNDEDSCKRADAAKEFTSYTRKVKNEDAIRQLSNLIPIVIEIIKGIDVNKRSDHLDSLLELIEAHPTIIDKEHIPTIVEFYMRIRIKSDDRWEKDTTLGELNWDDQGRLLTALKESNVLETAISIAHSFMHKGDWKERCMGLQGFVAIARQGRGSMKEHIAKMTPLLNDPNPRVRSYACLALGEIASHSDSESKERTHEMIILPLISALKDEIPKVVAHAASGLCSFIDNCSKEILMRHLNPMIEATLKFAIKEMIRIRESANSEYPEYINCQIVGLLSSMVERAEKYIDPLNPDLMPLLKSCLKECIKMKEFGVQLLENIIDCISLVGRSTVKETFIKDVDEILHLLVGCSSRLESHTFKGIARWCEIIGSDFARLLPLVIDDIVKMASSAPLFMPRGMTFFDYMFFPDRTDADAALTTFSKTLGVDFAPHVDEVFKAAQQHLKYPIPDRDCWPGEIFPLLLICLDAKGVDAKRVLWTQFWPAIKKAVKEINSNEYSTLAMKAITRSIEILGSKGITEEEKAEICEWIGHEVEALKKRRQEKDDKESEASISEASSPTVYENRSSGELKKYDGEEKKKRDKEWKESENGLIKALKELCKVGAKILGASFSINRFPLTELTGDDGADK